MLKKGNKIGVMVMDLSKSVDVLHRNLFLCKLKAYDTNALMQTP